MKGRGKESVVFQTHKERERKRDIHTEKERERKKEREGKRERQPNTQRTLRETSTMIHDRGKPKRIFSLRMRARESEVTEREIYKQRKKERHQIQRKQGRLIEREIESTHRETQIERER